MLEGPKGMAGAVLPLDGDNLDIAALRDKIVNIVTDERVRQAMYDAVPGAAAKFDPAILADKHDIVYRAALEVVV